MIIKIKIIQNNPVDWKNNPAIIQNNPVDWKNPIKILYNNLNYSLF